MRYALMNKDAIVAEYEETYTVFDTVEYVGVTRPQGYAPFGLSDINVWIDGRRIAKHRKAIQRLLNELGMADRHSFIGMARCLSLNDTFWMKPADKDLAWADVSLYTNAFDDVIAHIAFDGVGMFGGAMSPTSPESPEFATSGSYDKCWIRDDQDDIFMVKRGSSGAANLGQEPYSEKLASDLLDAAGIEHVPYSVVMYRGRLASSCPLFTSEDEGFVPACQLMDGRATMTKAFSLAEEHGEGDRIREMLVMDAVMCNTDRHGGNFGWMVDNDSGTIKRMAPLFDHNLACLPHMMEGNDLEHYLSGLPGHRLAGFFEATAKSSLTSRLRAILIDLKGFDYANPGLGCPQWRIEMLNRLKDRQIDLILGSRTIALSSAPQTGKTRVDGRAVHSSVEQESVPANLPSSLACGSIANGLAQGVSLARPDSMSNFREQPTQRKR